MRKLPNRFMNPTCMAGTVLLLCSSLSGCLLVGGYRSGSGFFIWPGSIGLFFVVLLVVFLLSRARR